MTAPEAQAYYGEFLRGVLNAKGGVLWHCSQGKDRAGWASAFVLAALGAERKVIVEDFDLTNQSYASKVDALLALLPDKEGSDEAAAFIRAMIGVSRENFETTLVLIDQQYGSMSQYIENQLGFSKKEQQQLRDKYLTFLLLNLPLHCLYFTSTIWLIPIDNYSATEKPFLGLRLKGLQS